MKNIIYYFKKLHETSIEISKKSKRFLLITFILIALPFLLLLLKENLYVFIIDVSGSMGEPIPGIEKPEISISKIEALKTAMNKFIKKKFEGDYVFVTYSSGKIFSSLDSIMHIESVDSLGGEILMFVNDNEKIANSMVDKISIHGYGTHLSEAFFKALRYTEGIYKKYLNIVFIVIGDGDDHCQAIRPGNNVVANYFSINNEYFNKMRVNCLLVSNDYQFKNNFEILSNDGKGKYGEVKYADEFYDSLLKISRDENIIYIHIFLSIIMFLLIGYILLKK